MKNTRNNKGIAMVMVLILSAIVLSLTASVIYLITQGTVISGSESRYATALDAGYGGLELFQQVIDDRGVLTVGFFGIALDSSVDKCLGDKLNINKLNTALAIIWANCAAPRLTDNPVQDPDMNFTLGAYNVNVKIVDTSVGNSNTSTLNLGGAGVVNQNQGLMTPPPVPYLYRINIRSENNQTREKADVTAVYAY